MHNYIERVSKNKFYSTSEYQPDDVMYVLRKGAISAYRGEAILIPMNMRDGSLICLGKGNADWNCSAPHGAGRIMSRSKAKEQIDIELFAESMKGIYSTSVNASTIDEAPMAYKPMDVIVNSIHDTAIIIYQVKPLYNFKANS
jgi:RNA-splicing ligase RtcB